MKPSRLVKKEYDRIRYLNNKERLKKQRRLYYSNNKEKVKATNREYRNNHKEETNEIARKWRKENKEYLKERKHYYNENKRLKMREYQRRPENRYKSRVRNMTIYKYGKLPKGMEYHHITIPYEVDRFVVISMEEHRNAHQRNKNNS